MRDGPTVSDECIDKFPQMLLQVRLNSQLYSSVFVTSIAFTDGELFTVILQRHMIY